MTIIKSALEQFALSNARTWESDRTQTIGASEIGTCARKVFWLKYEGDSNYGVARDPEFVDSWGAKVRGTYYEDNFWEPALRARYGSSLLYAGKDQKTFVSGFLSATPDGLVVGGGSSDQSFTVECKTIDPRVNLTAPKEEHSFQAQVQMGMIRTQTAWHPEYAILSYTDASFWDVVTEFKIDFDSTAFTVAKARAEQIMMAKSGADLEPEGWIEGGKECDYCPFTRACGNRRAAVPDKGCEIPLDPATEDAVTGMAIAIKELQEDKEEGDIQIRSLQERMKTMLRESGSRGLNNDRVKISWSSVKGRETFDNKAIQEAAVNAGIDIDKYKKVGEGSDRLQITVKETVT